MSKKQQMSMEYVPTDCLHLPVVSSDRRCTVIPPVKEKTRFCQFATSLNAFSAWPCISQLQAVIFSNECFLSSGLFRRSHLSSLILRTTRFWTAPLGDQPLPLFACNIINTLDLIICKVVFFVQKSMFCFFPTIFISSTNTDKNNPSFLYT